MNTRWFRFLAGLVVFAVVTYIGVTLFGSFGGTPDPSTGAYQRAANSFALILAIAMVAGLATFLGIEWFQTGRLDSIASQFGIRTYALMVVGIAINIVLGATVANALKIPIYLDSIGTILVGVLCGPIAGALTGGLANVLWSYVIPPPFQYPPAAAFAIVAFAIGLAAGVAGRAGFMRPRPNSSVGALAAGAVVALAIVGGMAYYALTRFYGQDPIQFFDPSKKPDLLFVVLAWLIALIFLTVVAGFLGLLFLRRDLSVAFVVVAGVLTGVMAALISAPIAAGVFGGVTASGTDFLVAAFRQAGDDIYTATLKQGLLSDPIDKLTTFFVVYLILNAMARRTKARFAQGERLVEDGESGEAIV
jgi:hypothetical protein